jgi:integrase
VANQPEEIQRVTAVFDVLDEALESNDSKRRYRSDIDDLYSWLVDRGYGAFNPVRYDHEWNVPKRDNPALSPKQVGQLAATADDIEDELIVLGLCAWGLRRSELANLHVQNVELQADSAHLSFDTRKNGPGTVALIYGKDVLETRIGQLSDREEWDGYLFPSPDARRDHMTGETLNRRFKSIATRADVRMHDDLPTSKLPQKWDVASGIVRTLTPSRMLSNASRVSLTNRAAAIRWSYFGTTSLERSVVSIFVTQCKTAFLRL